MSKELRGKIWFYFSNLLCLVATVVLSIYSYKVITPIGVVAGISISAILLVATIIFNKYNKVTIAKLLFIFHVVLVFVVVLAYVFEVIGIFEVADNVNDMRDFISQFGVSPKWIFIALQFVQVLFLPIPATISILAGLLLFQPHQVVLYSMIGIMPASIIMFFFGRYAGRGMVNWIIGEETTNKYLTMIKGKDVSLLTVMFLMPFLPDDTLCVVAGLSTMKFWYFTIVIFITRMILCLFSVYIMGSGVIPFSGGGMLIWAVIGAGTLGLLVLTWKKGDVVQEKIAKLFSKKEKK